RNINGTFFMDASGFVPSQSGELKIGSGTGANLKATDVGIDVTAGYKLPKHFFLRFRYQMGLVNLNPSGDDKNSIKTSAIGITAGYMFGRCRSGGYGSMGRGRGGDHWRGLSKAKWSRRDRHPRYPQ